MPLYYRLSRQGNHEQTHSRYRKRKNVSILEYTTRSTFWRTERMPGIARGREGNEILLKSRLYDPCLRGRGRPFSPPPISPTSPGRYGRVYETRRRASGSGLFQIQPTTLIKSPGRRFLFRIGPRRRRDPARRAGKPFVNELLPGRCQQAIFGRWKRNARPCVALWKTCPRRTYGPFPHIYESCLDHGYDMMKEPIPVVSGTHYFMGGIQVDHKAKRRWTGLYAVGETSCNVCTGQTPGQQFSVVASFSAAPANRSSATTGLSP